MGSWQAGKQLPWKKKRHTIAELYQGRAQRWRKVIKVLEGFQIKSKRYTLFELIQMRFGKVVLNA